MAAERQENGGSKWRNGCRSFLLWLMPWLCEHIRLKAESARVAGESEAATRGIRDRMVRIETSIRTRTPLERIP